MYASENHCVRHLGLSVDHPVGLVQNFVHVRAVDQLVLVHIQVKDALFARHLLANVTTKPDGYIGLDRGLGNVHEHLDRLVVVRGGPATNHVAQAVYRVGLTDGILGTWIADKTDFVVHIKVLLHVQVVEVQRRDIHQALGLLGLVVILPRERGWRDGQAYGHNSENGKYIILNPSDT